MFVGETGVGRTIQATADAMNRACITDPYDINAIRDLGVIDLPTIQEKAEPALFPVARPVRSGSVDQRGERL